MSSARASGLLRLGASSGRLLQRLEPRQVRGGCGWGLALSLTPQQAQRLALPLPQRSRLALPKPPQSLARDESEREEPTGPPGRPGLQAFLRDRQERHQAASSWGLLDLLEDEKETLKSARRREADKRARRQATAALPIAATDAAQAATAAAARPGIRSYHDIAREALADRSKTLVVLEGPAGAGKTYAACQVAAKLLVEQKKTRVRLVRPCVAVEGESHGFLPGDITNKLLPWMLPVIDQLETLLSPVIVAGAMKDGRLVFEPISHIRGRSFADSFVIADEMQNATRLQTLTLLTRLGEGSRIVVTGDLMQSDLGPDNGLRDLIDRLYRFDAAAVHITRFGTADIKRSAFVADAIQAYAK